MLKKKFGLIWLLLSVVVIIADQWLKFWSLNHLLYQQPKIIFSTWLNFTLAFNRGAAFSFLGSAGGWQIYFFAFISLLIVLLFTLWLSHTPRGQYWRSIGLSLVIGGALGNLIDRLRLNYVIDFVDVHVHTWHFATFNLADAAISVGATCLIISLLSRTD